MVVLVIVVPPGVVYVKVIVFPANAGENDPDIVMVSLSAIEDDDDPQVTVVEILLTEKDTTLLEEPRYELSPFHELFI